MVSGEMRPTMGRTPKGAASPTQVIDVIAQVQHGDPETSSRTAVEYGSTDPRSPIPDPRSPIPIVMDQDPWHTQVHEHVKANGLVLTFYETFNDEAMMFGSGICEVYLLPEKRGVTFNDWESADGAGVQLKACPFCDHWHDPDAVHFSTEPGDCSDCMGLHR
ncbi:hypothetical protein ACLMAJ_22140 [Nocardia sp. KC 131]|uniref:hypothetical protein n=1 Tax=Nocardia arseniciresistens TaxID=3392119 RepID=UPI00398E4A2A